MEVSPHDEERVKEPMADPNVARVLAYHQLISAAIAIATVLSAAPSP